MPTPDTPLGPNGAAVFHYYRENRLRVGADSSVDFELQQPGGTTDADISGFTSFEVNFRASLSEDITTAPLFTGSAAYTGAGTGTDGALTVEIAGDDIPQTAIGRGFWTCHGIAADGSPSLLICGRYECEGGTRQVS